MGERKVIAELEYKGEQYTVPWEHPEDTEEDLIYYMWTEGNYSCDCNRMAFISDEYEDFPVKENFDDEDLPSFLCGETVKLVGLTLDGKDLLAPTVSERLRAIGLV